MWIIWKHQAGTNHKPKEIKKQRLVGIRQLTSFYYTLLNQFTGSSITFNTHHGQTKFRQDIYEPCH